MKEFEQALAAYERMRDLWHVQTMDHIAISEARAALVAMATRGQTLLQEVAASGVEYDAGKYVTVQIGKETWQELAALAPRIDFRERNK